MRIAVIIPTRGNRRDSLQALIDECSKESFCIYVVRTDPSAQVPSRAYAIDDFGPLNIQRWWNRGIKAAERGGADIAAVLNDDVLISGAAIYEIATVLVQTGCTLATPGKRLKIYRRSLPPRRIVDGSCWALNLTHGLRPDERFRWGFGDDDLDIRARTHHYGLVTVPVEFVHLHRNRQTSESTYLMSLAAEDRRQFRRRYWRVALLRRPREVLASAKHRFLG